MTQPLDFQSIIFTLQTFWARHGCLIWQPYHTEVGAGTNNPGTYLRVLGPEPYNVGYVEPSIRPDDGRYGENPNRMYQHYQFQVILKPDPGNPQELYIQSLEALGIDMRQHDIRFVEDNWESPALGAWGLGWEVWLDGLEITQFTYFQQAGGAMLDPVAVEITYGLERIAMALQHARDFKDIRWTGSLAYGDVYLQSEQEFSRYAFEVADVERLRQMYDHYRAEAEACLSQQLVLPAHDYVLKCSHTFNLLDTRGVVGVTERQALFGQMRDLSRRVAEAYLEQRRRLEYPWMEGVWQPLAQPEGGIAAPAGGAPAPDEPAALLFEIGVEELPAADLDAALAQLKERLPALLAELRLEHAGFEVMGTPRRLVIYVRELAPRQKDLEQVVKGPPAGRAFDALGQPTQAAIGFARSKGVEVSELAVKEIDGGSYIAAIVRQAGRPTPEVLAQALPGLIAGLRFDKAMRWNASNVSFSRPIRWLLALYGGQVVPFEYAGLRAGNTTRGLRFLQPERLAVADAVEYFRFLAGQGILLDPQARKEHIQVQVRALASQSGGQVVVDPALLAEVCNLVEAPTPLLGSFDPQHLELPQEVLISVMKKHQRCFPVSRPARPGQDSPGLLPHFIAVRNGDDQHLETVTEGNADVIRARFSDAAYFVRADQKRPLSEYLPRLASLTFQKDLGSMLDKSRRLEALVADLAPLVSLSDEELATARRAAALCKADLATQMVVDMTSLQGVMGRYYALRSGETPAAAQAIYEHYLPRFTGDNVPQGKPGLLVGLADRLDTLVGLFAVGLAPTGAKDPFALRRAALGLVQSLIAWGLNLDLREALRLAADRLPVRCDSDELTEALIFIVERLRNLLLEQGYRYDVVDAVLLAQGRNPASAAHAVGELSRWVARPDWHTILPAYARCVRITRDKPEMYEVLPEALVEPAEKELCHAIRAAQVAPRRPGSAEDLLNTFLPMIPAITRFFDDVLVMAEDPILRTNRLGMLKMIAALADGVADFSRLEGF